jgi:hypothetical protein
MNLEVEMVQDSWLFEFGIALGKSLDKRFGIKRNTLVLSQRDVPGKRLVIRAINLNVIALRSSVPSACELVLRLLLHAIVHPMRLQIIVRCRSSHRSIPT